MGLAGLPATQFEGEDMTGGFKITEFGLYRNERVVAGGSGGFTMSNADGVKDPGAG